MLGVMVMFDDLVLIALIYYLVFRVFRTGRIIEPIDSLPNPHPIL